MTSFRATFGLTRLIGGWEEGERRERKTWKRQPKQTGAWQRREWQLHEQSEEIKSIRWRKRRKYRRCIISVFALFVQLPFSSLSCAGSSWLPLPRLSFPSFCLLPTPNRPCQSESSSKARHEADSFEPAELSDHNRLTPWQSGWIGAAAVWVRSALSIFSLSSTSISTSLSSKSIFISQRCSFSCHFLLCPAPVRPSCLFRFFLSFFFPPPNPQSTLSVRTQL